VDCVLVAEGALWAGDPHAALLFAERAWERGGRLRTIGAGARGPFRHHAQLLQFPPSIHFLCLQRCPPFYT